MVDSSDGINETEGRGICRFLCKNSNLSNHVYYNGGRVDENFSCLLSLFFIMNEIIISSFFKNKEMGREKISKWNSVWNFVVWSEHK